VDNLRIEAMEILMKVIILHLQTIMA